MPAFVTGPISLRAVLDGVYRCTEGEPVFDAARAPTGDKLAGLLEQIVARLMKMLTRSGHLVEKQGMTWLAESDARSGSGLSFRHCQA